MKTRIILLICISVLITACSPQVTVTLTPPPTATPIPTPTLHPQFIAIQEQIAAAGERFTLNSDGTVQDGATTIPGLHVAPDGKVTLTVNGEQVEIDPSIMHFDDENGLSIDDYEDPDEDGVWTEAQETITTPSGIGFALGAQIEGQPEGVREVTDIVPPDVMDAKKQADFETRTNPTTYGFGEGETRLVYIPTEDGKGRVELQRTSNPADVIAVFGSTDFVWKTAQIVDENGDPVFLNTGQIVVMKGGVPVNINSVRSFSTRLSKEFHETNRGKFAKVQYFTFISKDGTRAVQLGFAHTDDTGKKGILFYMDKDMKTLRWIYVEDFDESLSFVEAVH